MNFIRTISQTLRPWMAVYYTVILMLLSDIHVHVLMHHEHDHDSETLIVHHHDHALETAVSESEQFTPVTLDSDTHETLSESIFRENDPQSLYFFSVVESLMNCSEIFVSPRIITRARYKGSPPLIYPHFTFSIINRPPPTV